LQAENEQLSNSLFAANNARSAQQEQLNELLKLRGEVGALRRQSNDLVNITKENQQLRSQLSAASKSPASPSPQKFPRESWAFAGYADPESAFQSAIWAMSQNDARTFLASLAPGGMLYREMVGKPEAEVMEKNKEEISKVKSFNILNKEMISDGEAILTIYAEGVNEAARFRMLRVGNDWKFSGPMKGEDPVVAK
jgi:hypothetical protein